MAKKPNNFVFESSSDDASSESSFSPDSEDCKTSDGEIDNTYFYDKLLEKKVLVVKGLRREAAIPSLDLF